MSQTLLPLRTIPGATVVLIIISSTIANFAASTIAPGDKAKQCTKQLKVRKGPQNDNVFDRHLVESEPLPKDILIENAAYYKETAIRRFNGTVLGYVTPWSSHGYDVAKIFARKFDIISPVWLEIIKQDDQYTFAGTHDIDSGWLKDVRKKSARNSIKLFPRIVFEKFGQKDFLQLLSFAEEREKLNQLVVDVCIEYGFDGVVLEFWSQLAGFVEDLFLKRLILEMSKSLQKENLQLILVIPPWRPGMKGIFNEEHLEALYKHVYAFSLMTYDFSSVDHPGPNAPLDWVRRAIENLVPANSRDFKTKRSKILMGLNMYGNDYASDGGGSIVAHQYLDLLKHAKKRLTFDEEIVENFLEIRMNSGRHLIFYPTLYSINERIKLAQEMAVGISIWELGQGLDYFYDLF